MKQARIILKTVLVSLPFLVAIQYGSWGIWLLSGFPLGYQPYTSELSPVSLLAYQVLHVFNFIQYLFYGILLAWFLRNENEHRKGLTIFWQGSLVGAVLALVKNALQAINPQVVAGFNYSFYNAVATVMAMIITIVLGLVLGGIGAFVMHQIVHGAS